MKRAEFLGLDRPAGGMKPVAGWGDSATALPLPRMAKRGRVAVAEAWRSSALVGSAAVLDDVAAIGEVA